MNIQFKLIHGCILFLLLTARLLSYADDFSISNYVISKQNSGNSGLVDIKIGWVTINLTSLDQSLTNDQRITVRNSREEYILNMNHFRSLLRFYYDFTSASTNDDREALSQMSQFLTQIFYLNAININRSNIVEIQRYNMNFFHSINLNNVRQGATNNNSEKKRRTAQRTRNSDPTESTTIRFNNFYSNPNDNLSRVNIGLVLLLASFFEPWIHTNVQVANNPLATVNDRLALTQQAFFSRVFQRVLSSANLPSMSTSPESTPRIDHEYDPFTFVTTENIIHFLNSTRSDRDFVFATLLRSLSISFTLHLIHRNVFSRERQSTPEGINRNYPAADTVQIVFCGYVRAYLQPRGVTIPFDCSFDSNYMQQMASDSQQLPPHFWANLALTHRRLADEEPTRLFTRLAGTDTPDADPPETPAIQQAVANPNANQPGRAQMAIAQLARLNAQLNARLNEQHRSGHSASSQECCICLEKKELGALMPCGHVITCEDCTKTISLYDPGDKCPLCRTRINKFIKLYYN